MGLILWILAIWGVAVDQKYIKAGGRKASHVETLLWSSPVVLFAAYLIFMMVANHEHVDWDKVAHGLGGMIASTFPAYLCLYEARRWFVRYKYPVMKKEIAREQPIG